MKIKWWEAALIVIALGLISLPFLAKTKILKSRNVAAIPYAVETPEQTLYVLSKIERIEPHNVKGIPSELVALLNQESCQVPKMPGQEQLFVAGTFFASTNKDYAILCVTPEGEMTIKVMGGKIRPCAKSIGYGMIAKFLSQDKKGEPVYFRKLNMAPSTRIQSLAKEQNVILPQHVSDGIEDMISPTQSTIYYCDGKSWQNFTASL